MLARGDLPAMARIQAAGGYGRVATSFPAQTPVAWSSFATGTNPGGHGIFDFLRRDPATYAPDLALNRYELRGPFLPPRVVNLRGGTPVWEVLSKAGIPSSILRCPCTYPPDKVKGRMLSGMGVPDLRGGFGISTLFTAREGVTPRESEQIVAVDREAGDIYRTHLIGPRKPKTAEDARTEITIRADPAAGQAMVESAGDPARLVIRLGEWSQ